MGIRNESYSNKKYSRKVVKIFFKFYYLFIYLFYYFLLFLLLLFICGLVICGTIFSVVKFWNSYSTSFFYEVYKLPKVLEIKIFKKWIK